MQLECTRSQQQHNMRSEDILELTGETSTSEVKELTLRNHKLQSLEDFAEHVPNLTVLSVSHNQICSLQGLALLRGLQSLNLNFNGLTSLEGIQLCSELRCLYLSSNRVRDLIPLEGLQQLQTLHLFRNNVTALDQAAASLAALPRLRELELGGNPCSTAEGYKHRLVLELQLESLDGEPLSGVDRDLAASYYEGKGEVPPSCAFDVQVLTLQGDDDAAGPSLSSEASDLHAAPGAAMRASGDGASTSGAMAPAPQLQQRHALPPRPGTQSSSRTLAGASGSFSRPGTAMPAPGSSGGGGRPSTAPGSSMNSVQLYSSELLNDHPLVLEYLAKHVLQEGMQLTQVRAARAHLGHTLFLTAGNRPAC